MLGWMRSMSGVLILLRAETPYPPAAVGWYATIMLAALY